VIDKCWPCRGYHALKNINTLLKFAQTYHFNRWCCNREKNQSSSAFPERIHIPESFSRGRREVWAYIIKQWKLLCSFEKLPTNPLWLNAFFVSWIEAKVSVPPPSHQGLLGSSHQHHVVHIFNEKYALNQGLVGQVWSRDGVSSKEWRQGEEEMVRER
jgi:hypothetical protein